MSNCASADQCQGVPPRKEKLSKIGVTNRRRGKCRLPGKSAICACHFCKKQCHRCGEYYWINFTADARCKNLLYLRNSNTQVNAVAVLSVEARSRASALPRGTKAKLLRALIAESIRRCQRGRCMHNPLPLAQDALACIDGAVFCLCNPV